MPLVSMTVGGLLIAIGVIGYVSTGSQHLTALIPALLGTVLDACGALALVRPAWRMHVMHVAVTVALLGFIASAVRGVPGLLKRMSGESLERPAAVYAQAATMLLCGVFIALCVRSFIAARRAREQAQMR